MRGHARRLTLGGLVLLAGLSAGLSWSSGPSTAKAAQAYSTGPLPTTTVDTTPTLPATTTPRTTTPATTTTPTTTVAPIPVGTTNPAAGGKTTAVRGKSIRLRARTKTRGCVLGPLPDRRCSPGAYYNGLTKAVLCSSGFHTSSIRNIPKSEKRTVESEYGLALKDDGRSLQIDQIVSLEIGGSNDISNLFPQRTSAYHAKDRLEKELHRLVCSGTMSLRAAQAGIADNWEALYKRVFGSAAKV